MSETIPELDRRFSSEGATPLPWPEVVEVLEKSEIFWLSSVRGDGRPHVTPLPAMWLDGALHFCTGPDEQKAKNLAANARCALTTGCNTFRSGVDVVVEGRAERVLDEVLLVRLAEMWESELDWSYDVLDGTFRDRSPQIAGAELDTVGIAHVFGVQPDKVIAFGKGEPFSQTRYRFRRSGVNQ